jgi:hypothetical protein
LTQEESGILDSPIPNKEIKFLDKRLPTKSLTGPNIITPEFYHTIREIKLNYKKFSEKRKRKSVLTPFLRSH